MANIDQVESQIRFQLEQLSIKNAHHEFEHLCRHLTRATICSNIMPATGPVSAGGDQGRDFETFRTYITSSPIANSTFFALVSQKPMVFACSLQKKGISGKIKDDVELIMSSGSPVEVVYYFCTSDLQVSKRHELDAWARDEYSIKLELHDGQSISELLADREVFWIAEKYLSIPSEIYPRTDNEADWYGQSLKSWRAKNTPNLNYGDFYELKAAVRHTTFSTEVRQDISFWISLLEKFIDTDSLPKLRQKAIYEVAVASLRGLGTLCDQEDRLREYFAVIPKLEDPVDLEDAAVLLNYCIGAIHQTNVQLTADELSVWRNKLVSRIEERLKAANMPSLKCPLLEIRGYLSFIDPLQYSPLDVEGAIEWWTQLTLVAKDAPLFPLERFADHLTGFIEFIDATPEYNYLVQQVDTLLSDRYGEFIAAEKCRDRAIKFYEQGNILNAINQLHHGKVKWFAEETLRGSLLSMLWISQCYLELGLSLAAKYYALAVSHIALQSPKSDVKSLVSRALIAAAECDYYQGSWCGFLELTDIGLKAHLAFSRDAGDLAAHDELQRTAAHTTTLIAITKRLDSRLFESVQGAVQEWNVNYWLKELLPVVHETWKKQDISELWLSIEEDLGGRPFGDLGTVREVTWSELGIVWNVNWNNDFDTTPAAEQFTAILQILLTDLAGIDLCLLKTDVNINICVEYIGGARVEPIPSNMGRKWKVTLPVESTNDETSEIERLQVNILAAASSILTEVSLLPSERLHEVFENCFRNGLSMKAFVAEHYEILYREFISKEVFESSNRSTKSIPESHRQFKIKEHTDLAWFDGMGPGYSKETVEEYLENRYSRSIIPIRCTIRRLVKHPEFISTVERLRADRWLDWHILTSILAAAINYRLMQNLDVHHGRYAQERLLKKIMDEPERENSIPVPLEEFTKEKLRMYQKSNMISTLGVLGLECRQSTPDFEAIDHFLRYRYNYWTDDIKHTDPFLYSNFSKGGA